MKSSVDVGQPRALYGTDCTCEGTSGISPFRLSYISTPVQCNAFLKPCVCCSQPTARIDESNSIQSLAFVILSGAHICNGVNFLERTIDL